MCLKKNGNWSFMFSKQ